jgi:hypothetical protein
MQHETHEVQVSKGNHSAGGCEVKGDLSNDQELLK